MFKVPPSCYCVTVAIVAILLCISYVFPARQTARGDKFPKRERKMTARDEEARRGLKQPVGR